MSLLSLQHVYDTQLMHHDIMWYTIDASWYYMIYSWCKIWRIRVVVFCCFLEGFCTSFFSGEQTFNYYLRAPHSIEHGDSLLLQSITSPKHRYSEKWPWNMFLSKSHFNRILLGLVWSFRDVNILHLFIFCIIKVKMGLELGIGASKLCCFGLLMHRSSGV